MRPERAETLARIAAVLCELGVPPGDEPVEAARRLLAAYDEIVARAEAQAREIRLDALVTAEGIRRIAMEDARELVAQLTNLLSGATPGPPRSARGTGASPGRGARPTR
jgi:hypothetical protein